ncbi:MAG: hypothetical protein COA60_001645 [Robiginitomaculum sp.]|nr:hypothetical protein [Robiginitomaculum sp.]
MKSIFDGMDELIYDALLLGSHQNLKQKSTCAKLSATEDRIKNIEPLVTDMYARIRRNWTGRKPSSSNWKLRRPSELNPNNRSAEVLLERAIVILSKRGLLDNWYNQMPIASGLLDSSSDKRAAIDWVHIEQERLELIELKWASDTPLYAIFEILRYALAYLFCFTNRELFDFQDLPTMNITQIKLTTLAPHEYYSYCDLSWLAAALNPVINALYREESDGFLSCEFNCSSFPINFKLLFETGGDVLALHDLPVDHPSIQLLLNALCNQHPAWEPKSNSR